MQHTPYTVSGGKKVHVAEEVLFPFHATIHGRVLCGGLKANNTYIIDVPKDLNRDKWFSEVDQIPEGTITCTKCWTRHLAFLKEMEKNRHGE